MNVLIVGCGKLGIRIAGILDHYGHTVSVLDEDEDRLQRLEATGFDGLLIAGMPMDMEVLRNAGIEACDAVAVVTADDNLNITVSQIVKEFFHVNNVVTRITDPAREAVFHNLGLRTICSTKLTCSAMVTALTQTWEEKQITFETCTMSFRMRGIDASLVGRPLEAIPMKSGEIITGVLHKDGSAALYDGRQRIILLESDRIIYTYLCD